MHRSQVTGYVPDNDGLKHALTGADIIVIPAGVPRKPGMTRDDLFNVWLLIAITIYANMLLARMQEIINFLCITFIRQMLESCGTWPQLLLSKFVEIQVLAHYSKLYQQYDPYAFSPPNKKVCTQFIFSCYIQSCQFHSDLFRGAQETQCL